jgi:hypothetical protein
LGFFFGGLLGAKFVTKLSNLVLERAFGVALLLIALSKGKPVQEGVRAKLPKDMTWERLAAMSPGEIREKNLFPAGFFPLPHPNHPEGWNFYIEARIYCPITEGNKGFLSGITFLIDPFRGSFYRLICDFKTNAPILDLAYVGPDTRNYPVYLNIWNSKEIPNGVPKESG